MYKAPYNCKVIKLLYPQGSGIGDGSPVIVIKKTIDGPAAGDKPENEISK